MKYPSEGFTKTMDAAVRFLARDNHMNVAKLFHKTGYTCELETHTGTFFESIVIDEGREVAEIRMFWGIRISEEYRSQVDELVRRINQYQEYICTTGVDTSGRIYTKTDISYEPCEISVDFFQCMEDACYSAIELFLAALLSVNVGKNIPESAFRNIVKEDYYLEAMLKERTNLVNLYLELKNKEDN